MKMLEIGILTDADVVGMRDQCLGSVRPHVDASSGARRAFADREMVDLTDLFRRVSRR